MMILIVESAPPSLRGELSKWMLEPRAGVYVGNVSGAVRDLLWKKACSGVRDGGCTMIYSAANEQGYEIRSCGDTGRIVEQWEGLFLVRRLRRLEEDAFFVAPRAMRLWAKADPFHPLPCHLVDVGYVALALLETNAFGPAAARLSGAVGLPEDRLKPWIGYIAALHDWGKGWPNFQARGTADVRRRLKDIGLSLEVEETDERIRHERISRLWLEEILQNQAGWNKRSILTVGTAIEFHHGRIYTESPTLQKLPDHEMWAEIMREVQQMVAGTFDPSPWQADFSDHGIVGTILAGLTVWADWIASNEELFPLRWQGETWSEYLESSRTESRDAVARLGLSSDNPWYDTKPFARLWPAIKTPRPIQSACIDLVTQDIAPGLAVIEAPMGEGKSEAALYLAVHWMRDGGGLYMGLPTAATSNQMYERVQAFLVDNDPNGAAALQLVHGTNWLLDEQSLHRPPELFADEEDPYGHLAHDWFRPRKRTLLATYGVGTVDQALMSVLHVKFGFLRLLGLTGKVLVIDEVHAYDAYMNTILDLLLCWCGAMRISVILLSATLPNNRRKELVSAYAGDRRLDGTPPKPYRETEISAPPPYPLITYAAGDGSVREIPAEPGDRRFDIEIVRHEGLLGDVSGIADLVQERIADDGCLCVIANTVDSAQKIYEELKSRDSNLPLLLFHARFLAADRQEIERRALEWFDKRSLLPIRDPRRVERPRRAVLIATQVVEQSLDLDFDEMITEIAPIDLLLQRVGRLQRHERPERSRRPRLHVLLPRVGSSDFGSTGRVYAQYILLRTRLVLTDRWLLPEALRPLVESVYGPALPGLEPDTVALSAAFERLEQEKADLTKKAEQYLIPPPYARAFKLGRMVNNVFEEDEGLQKFFAARTRSGDSTMRIALVPPAPWTKAVEAGRAPKRDVLQQWMLRTVNVPRWWLHDVAPADGWEDPGRAPRWLPAERIVWLRNGEWRGTDARGRDVRLTVDPELGVRLILGEEP